METFDREVKMRPVTGEVIATAGAMSVDGLGEGVGVEVGLGVGVGVGVGVGDGVDMTSMNS
jgi:hypothetical protein